MSIVDELSVRMHVARRECKAFPHCEFRRAWYRKARDAMVNAHIGLAYCLANKSGLSDPDEAESRALDGLLKAVEKYRLGRGFKFSVYAGKVIKRSILRAFRELRRPIRRRERLGRREVEAFPNAADDGTLRKPSNCERFADNGGGHRIDSITDAMDRAGLDDQERAVIDGICRDESRKEIARRLGFTLYKVRRIEKSAREKIAHEIEP